MANPNDSKKAPGRVSRAATVVASSAAVGASWMALLAATTIGLGHLDRQEIEQAFPEFRPFLGQCRFRDCQHNREPDCALSTALKAGTIDARRFAVYHRIIGTQRPE